MGSTLGRQLKTYNRPTTQDFTYDYIKTNLQVVNTWSMVQPQRNIQYCVPQKNKVTSRNLQSFNTKLHRHWAYHITLLIPLPHMSSPCKVTCHVSSSDPPLMEAQQAITRRRSSIELSGSWSRPLNVGALDLCQGTWERHTFALCQGTKQNMIEHLGHIMNLMPAKIKTNNLFWRRLDVSFWRENSVRTAMLELRKLPELINRVIQKLHPTYNQL